MVPQVSKEELNGKTSASLRAASTAPCGNCINPRTNKTFVIEDECDIADFHKNCPNCDEVQCVFTM